MYRSKAVMLIHKFLLSKYIYKTIFLFDSGSKAVLFFFDRMLSGEVSC